MVWVWGQLAQLWAVVWEGAEFGWLVGGESLVVL